MFWSFWRRLRRSDSHASQNDTGYPPPSVKDAERRSALLEKLEIAAGIGVICGVVAEDFDVLNMVIHPLTREGVKAIGGICVALFIALEIYFSRSSANAEQFARDWYAAETERLRKENNEFSRLLSDRRIPNSMDFEQAMHQFAGTSFLVIVDPSREAKEFAAQLRYCLDESNWTQSSMIGQSSMLWEGVYIAVNKSEFDVDESCGPAGEALADWLNSIDVATITMAHERNDLATGTVLIQVGSKPSTVDRNNAVKKGRKDQKRDRRQGP